METIDKKIDTLRIAMKGYAKDAREFGFCPKVELAVMRKKLNSLTSTKK